MAKKTKPMLVNFVLDETGSMDICRDATITGYNEYVASLKKNKAKVLFTLTKFDSTHITIVHDAVPIKEVSDLTHATYEPGAMTPLYDAIAHTIKSIEVSIKKKKVKPSVLCVIMTDGEENASKEYTRDAVFALIKDKEKEGWTFAYLGANQDAYAVSQSIGIAKGSTMNYAGTPGGTQSAMKTLRTATQLYSDAGAQAASESFFSDVQDEEEEEGWVVNK